MAQRLRWPLAAGVFVRPSNRRRSMRSPIGRFSIKPRCRVNIRRRSSGPDTCTRADPPLFLGRHGETEWPPSRALTATRRHRCRRNCTSTHLLFLFGQPTPAYHCCGLWFTYPRASAAALDTTRTGDKAFVAAGAAAVGLRFANDPGESVQLEEPSNVGRSVNRRLLDEAAADDRLFAGRVGMR